ncbi:ATP-binding protein [Photobacterium alginatilyticum]|uniref:histidine kinase n=1 Tax=Photobacterium alginatilyticum TaxID=1775171 RepID=A0ABW9YFI3_9GAMM|nr:ATP-binding protein [Photobacterium alginatilyticum]NBI52423.1 HAMP domain-containing protein [Photobacterium alginatilyticum]
MKRLYCEFFIGIAALFFLSILSYVYVTQELTPDSEEVIEFNQAHSVVYILDDVADSVSQSHADELLARYAEENQLSLSVYQWDNPELSDEIIDDLQTHQIYLNDSYSYFVVYGDSRQVFKIEPDLTKPIWQQLDFDETLLWIFFYTGFAIYSALMLVILSRRFRVLEQTTLAFAEGDFAVRASEKPGDRLGSLNSSFNQMADKISALITSHKQLTNAVAHELRTPVFRVQCQLEMLEDSGISPEQLHYVAGIHDDMAELEQMIEELLYFAKMERAAIPLNLTSPYVSDWLDKLVSKCQKDTDITINVDYQTDDSAAVDVYQLTRAVSNIVRNASRYAEQRIDLRVFRYEQALHIQIDDDGIGIPQDERARILEPFYRVGTARDRESGGHGLGLAIVAQIMARHQGKVEIGASDSGGARFTLIVPQALATD